MFTNKDLTQITSKGMVKEDVLEQLDNFKKGFPLLPITEAVTLDKGLIRLSENELTRYTQLFEDKKSKYSICKFTPASGAATRMFQHLYETMNSGKKSEKIAEFFEKIDKFAFYPHLKESIKKAGQDIEELLAKKEHQTILAYLLTDKGLNMGETPKALIHFHLYGDEARTAVEEHLVEAAHYAAVDGKASLHFTVSPEHRDRFTKWVKKIKAKYEKRYQLSYEISFSEQAPNTDIIAANPDGSPFREENGKLLFRPGGHGALLQNLNALEDDLIILKNIDNIIVDKHKETTYTYKKVLTGMAIEYAEKIAAFIHRLNTEDLTDELLSALKAFISSFIVLPDAFDQQDQDTKKKQLTSLLNRPIRICGMVPSDEDTGGGPFWVQQADGSKDMQIVETAQLNMNDPDTLKKTKQATHFNPVDIVCYVKDHEGKKFNLMAYRNPETGFITKKSKDGKELLAQELPGLWNGSMANWVSVLVEAPPITFNPVKSVNDLLLPTHQG